jgi:hypothetical protein
LKKVLIIIPDGVGLRNFAYTNFVSEAKKRKMEIVFWNNTDFDLKSIDCESIQLPANKFHYLSDFVKQSKIELLLENFSKKFENQVFIKYILKNKIQTLKSLLKFFNLQLIKFLMSFINPLEIQKYLNYLERKSLFYQNCKGQLKKEKPDFVFTTSQRSLSSLSPLLAAKDLGIQTGSFIFSWDNLPKATLLVDTDFYFVWSEYMKNELIKYYNISENAIKITGTPQFEPYYDLNNIIPKNEFYEKYFLDTSIKYVCFSGDDYTTSPFDPFYLRDLAESITIYNQSSNIKYGIIFRRCPVDVSERYDWVLKEYNSIIFPIEPDWKTLGISWNQIMPMPNDTRVLVSTVFYSECVFNIGSSMVFDFANFNKPCYYFNYNVNENKLLSWNIKHIYEFIHFKSMPKNNPIGWINKKQNIFNCLNQLNNHKKLSIVINSKKWFNTVAKHPVELASQRIVDEIQNIIKNKF